MRFDVRVVATMARLSCLVGLHCGLGRQRGSWRRRGVGRAWFRRVVVCSCVRTLNSGMEDGSMGLLKSKVEDEAKLCTRARSGVDND